MTMLNVTPISVDTDFAAGAAEVDMYRAALASKCSSSLEERQARLSQIRRSLALKPVVEEVEDSFFFEEVEECGECRFF